MKSKTQIEKKLNRKTNQELVKLVRKLKKNKNWLEVANVLSYPRRKRISKNIQDINEEVKDNEIVVVPGKVLSMGSIDKKARIVAFSFSRDALRKLKEKGCDAVLIEDELNKNPHGKGLKILK